MKQIILTLFLGMFLGIFLIGLVNAGNYSAGTYGSGVYGIGEVISPPEDGNGGGGTTTVTCTYNWVCTNWFPAECPESGTQERICVNKGTCTGTIGMPNQTRTCIYEGPTEPIFDIFLAIPQQYKEICAGEEIKADIKLENYGKIELLDAFMTYWIINQNNTLIAELKDTRAVEDRINFDVTMKIPELTSKGTYRLYAQIIYEDNKTAIAGESFEIIGGKYCKFYLYVSEFYSDALRFYSDNSKYISFVLIGIGVLVIIILIIFIVKKTNKKTSGKGRKGTKNKQAGRKSREGTKKKQTERKSREGTKKKI